MSRQYFDFSSLIADYSTVFTVVTHSETGYDGKGDWKTGNEERTEMRGAIVGFRQSKVFRSEGTITAKDKRLFMLVKLPDAFIGAKVEHRGQTYMVESELENAEFTGVYSYLLRWCSAFDTL